jgi:hypothetical protein
MIEQETILTVFGIILLGISYGLSSAYISNGSPDWRVAGSVLPFGMNLAVMLYIAYGLFSVSKLSDKVKVFIMLGFIVVSYIELSIMYDRPSTWYGINTTWLIVTASTLLRLYFIISLHCDLTKSIFVIAAKSIVEPGKSLSSMAASAESKSESKPEPNWDKAFSTFESALRKTQLSPDEKMEQINKFRAAWGKPPKEVVIAGGKRR